MKGKKKNHHPTSGTSQLFQHFQVVETFTLDVIRETPPQSGTEHWQGGGKGVLTKCHGGLDKRSKSISRRLFSFFFPAEPGAVC